VGALEDELADHLVVRPVGQPFVTRRRLGDALAEDVRWARLPGPAGGRRAVLDVGDAERARQPSRETGLAAPTRPDDRDPHQERPPLGTAPRYFGARRRQAFRHPERIGIPLHMSRRIVLVVLALSAGVAGSRADAASQEQ